MPTTLNGKVQFGGGEALPEVGSQAYVAAQNGQFNPLNSYTTGYSTPGPTVMTPADLAPETPLKIAQPKASTGYTGLGAALESTSNAFTEEQKALTEAKKSRNASKDRYLNELLGAKTKTGLEDEAYVSEGVDLAKKELNDINQQMIAEQRSLQKQIESLRATPGGTVTGTEEAVRAVERRSISKQADLAVIQMAKQNNYFGAKEIADRKVQAELEEDRNRLEAYKLDYEDNKDFFDKTEQRQYEQKIRERERELDKKDAELKQLSDTKLALLRSANEQGAPVSVLTAIQNAGDVATAVNAAGQYGGDIIDRQYKQAQLQKMQADAKKALAELGTPVAGPLAKAHAEGNVTMLSELATSKHLDEAVGPNPFGRASFTNLVTSGKSNFIAGIQQMTSQLTIDKLVEAKKNGATFGSLTEGERQEIASAATKINSWAIKDDSGKVIGYKTSEDAFKAELDKITNYAKLDYLVKGGDPEAVGVQVMEDGTYWTENSNGTFTQLNPKN